MSAIRLFISHSSQDNEWCRELVAALTHAGLDVWYDERGLSGGAAWVETLQREVAARDVFLLVLTPAAWASEWVREEVQLALATRRAILPVLREQTAAEGFLTTRQWVDVIGLDGEKAATRILTALRSPVVFPEAPTPKQVVTVPHIVAGRLAQLGFVGQTMDGVTVIIPPMCRVPAGPFLLGSDPRRDPEASDDEMPQRQVQVAEFEIGKFPVTVAEYSWAVQVGAVARPSEWDRQLQQADHPVVLVTWKAAQAYAKWLSVTSGEQWRLPTEEEWEKAARGTDGRVYPWGDQWDSSRANTAEGGPDSTVPVGSYPAGVSPYGAWDMAGEVNEWCGIPADSPLATPGSGQGKGYLAGGSWKDSPTMARAAYRAQLYVGERNDDIGFRLVRVPR